ncbi:uncharacterized protein LOC132603991 isoform X2 [Lycium barbarum]|uniref:uncharacterized protein LOC132603991 isoform X2 n=1 Tax=Lycium barbarum TaxID=112863 RepID=UPI00293E023C|nr:uncharacterized protein LOC132603991 isoform X2 [Lycium barbarum]
MQGDLNGLKILIQKESKASFKCRDELRESQAKEIEEALCKGELETDRGLNQELGLARVGDTRWGSHYKSFKNFILMFGPIIDVLDAIAVNARFEEKCREKGYLKACLTFEVVFMLHFMRTILAITNELNAAFQKKEQDIANAMLLVGVAKERLQKLREEGWDSLIDELFTLLHGDTAYEKSCVRHCSIGWSVEANLQVWLNRKAFKVGDVLVFNYDPKLHNLAQVDITGYNTCLPTNILSIDNSGKTSGGARISIEGSKYKKINIRRSLRGFNSYYIYIKNNFNFVKTVFFSTEGVWMNTLDIVWPRHWGRPLSLFPNQEFSTTFLLSSRIASTVSR